MSHDDIDHHISEECFQENQIDFVGDVQMVQYGKDRSNRTEFRANRTMDGTFPAGSEWTKNPIPACAVAWESVLDMDKDCKEGTQFDHPAPGLKGFVSHIHNPGVFDFHFSIIDHAHCAGACRPDARGLCTFLQVGL